MSDYVITCGKCGYKWVAQGKEPKTPMCSKCKNTKDNGITTFDPQDSREEYIKKAVGEALANNVPKIVKTELSNMTKPQTDSLTGESTKSSSMEYLIDIGAKIVQGIVEGMNKPKMAPQYQSPPLRMQQPQVPTDSSGSVVYDPASGRFHLRSGGRDLPSAPVPAYEPQQVSYEAPPPEMQGPSQEEVQAIKQQGAMEMETAEIQQMAGMLLGQLKAMTPEQIQGYIESRELIKQVQKNKSMIMLFGKKYLKLLPKIDMGFIENLLAQEAPETLKQLKEKGLMGQLGQQLDEVKTMFGFEVSKSNDSNTEEFIKEPKKPKKKAKKKKG